MVGIKFCMRVIISSFYAIFFLVPLIFAGNTSELFELNKMWVTFILTILVGGAWFIKMILERKIFIQRTPLDIPILLFLLSQIIATLLSLDSHISWWGYYSRFNGGLLSTLSYILLYYAAVSNLSRTHVLTLLKVTLVAGIATALWGLPSHFGFDPTCLVFRGSFDTACWTDAFRPTVRVFSTLGQPAWFAAYLAVLLPLALAYALRVVKQGYAKFGMLFAIILLFYSNLIFTNTRAGFLAFVAANILFWLIIFIKKIFPKKIFLRYFIMINVMFVLCNFIFGIPVEQFYKLTIPGIKSTITKNVTPQSPTIPTQPTQQTIPNQINVTDSGNIRIYVWKGAIDAWKSSPLFGTGVETFAFAYYKFRPAGHNLTSEWDYLYNKAHNEYLNYLTTTGLFGLGTYLSFIGLFSFLIMKPLLVKNNKSKNDENTLLIVALFTGWVSILISNFFGFSVVMMNLFLFLIPAFVLILDDMLNLERHFQFPLGVPSHSTNPYQWTIIGIIIVLAGSFIISLCRYWYADTKYALGTNLDRVGSYKDAYPLLIEAVKLKPNEPVYKDELAINLGVLATALAAQKEDASASQFANNAITLSTEVVTKHPNNVVFWKNRVRLFYTLAQQGELNQQSLYYQEALKSIQKAAELAPTDAKIMYNLGVLYGQTGDSQKGIEILEQTIKLKPDYRDPYFALGLFYHQLAVDQNNIVTHPELQKKAIETYQYILKYISPNDEEVKKTLKEWGAE